MRRFFSGLRREKGVTVTEFAILAPTLFLLILCIMEGGRIFSTWLIVTDEAREGARFAVVRYGDPTRQPTLVQDVRNHVISRVGKMVSADPSKLTVIVQLNQSDPASVTVTIDYRVDIITPLVQNLLPNPFPLHAASVMRAE